MRVRKYIPDKMYGFLQVPDSEREIFFHLAVFRPGDAVSHPRCRNCPVGGCQDLDVPPPPILGESVEVELGPDPEPGKAQKATLVLRVGAPVRLRGRVQSMEALRGFGFILGEDLQEYHLHRSEVLEHRLPVQGEEVLFFAGEREGRPRACHVKVCP